MGLGMPGEDAGLADRNTKNLRQSNKKILSKVTINQESLRLEKSK